ncbi:MAG: hypothetical protein KDM64_00420 [Verrucomicrobiae bacterium]|nr:hypothetical protein [Verrucomicrobiae bacterium]
MSEPVEAGERLHYVLEEVRVIYSIEGELAVPTEDLDGNGTPDRVEDVALRVWAAREFIFEMRYDAAAAYWNPLAASFEKEARFRRLSK